MAEALCSLYRHCWRYDAPPSTLTPSAIEGLVPALMRGGGAGVAWRRVRESAPNVALRDAFDFQSAATLVWRDVTSDVCGCLRRAKIHAVIAKGWTLAREYPELACRPYGDVDVFVPSTSRAQASVALEAAGLDRHVDRHVQLGGVSTFDDINSRARHVLCEGEEVATLGPEDELRYLCVHYAKHGGARPIWLCDVALVMERALCQSVDWAHVLGPVPAVHRTVEAVMTLAVTMLGARIGDSADLPPRSPRWLVDDTLRTWLHGRLRPERTLRFTDLRHLGGSLRNRFPNALRATHALGASYSYGPRLPLRIAAFGVRGGEFFGLR